MPEAAKKLVVLNVNQVEEVAAQVDFVFSAVDMSTALNTKSTCAATSST